MNTYEVKFIIYLDMVAYYPIQYTIQVQNFNRINTLFSTELVHEVERIKIVDTELDLNRVYYLGAAMCSQIFNWNRDLQDKIVQDMMTYYSKSEDKEFYVRDSIEFPNLFFENFSFNTKELNKNVPKISSENKKITTDFGYPDLILPTIDSYNNKFQTDFVVSKIESIDQMYFADIIFDNVSLIDIFCLGFDVCLMEQIRNKKKREGMN